MTTVASNATKLTLEQGQWFKFNPLASLIITFGMIASLVLSFKYSFYYLILFGVILVVNKIYWWVIERRFQQGDYNIGRVVSTSPMLIAVPTDLRKGGAESFPVIKIVEIKFNKVGDRDLMLGDKLGTNGMYDYPKDDNTPFWEGFDPIPVFYGNSNFEAHERRVEASITQEDWAEFERNLGQLPKPYQKGLYKIKTSASSWHKYPDAQLKDSHLSR
jgi:hypothetical protein